LPIKADGADFFGDRDIVGSLIGSSFERNVEQFDPRPSAAILQIF